VRLSNSQDVSLIQRVLITLVLRPILNDGFSFDSSIACSKFFRISLGVNAREGLRVGADGSSSQRARAYMLDTRNEEKNTVFYSCLACFVNTVTLHIYVSISYTGLARGPDAYVARCAPKRTVCCRRRLDMEPGCESGSRLKVLRVPK